MYRVVVVVKARSDVDSKKCTAKLKLYCTYFQVDLYITYSLGFGGTAEDLIVPVGSSFLISIDRIVFCTVMLGSRHAILDSPLSLIGCTATSVRTDM
jgi:hypothetical protein